MTTTYIPINQGDNVPVILDFSSPAAANKGELDSKPNMLMVKEENIKLNKAADLPPTRHEIETESDPIVVKDVYPTSPTNVFLSKNLVTLTFKDLKYSVRVRNKNRTSLSEPKYVQKEILKGMTGICKPKQLTAIMGASGAGKTTLLNILSLRTTGTNNNKLSGEFLANGQTYDLGKFSKFAGYVMQNDILYETLTPRGFDLLVSFVYDIIEIFEFTANLRLNGTSSEKKQKLERAADTLVGGTFAKGISGGERKRASIGVEMITDPNLLFLDEPTSGLDSFTAFILISLLKNITVKRGKTIVFTIHQPSTDIFFLFDNLMLLAKGKFIYQGPVRTAVEFFGSIGYQFPEYSNPADYFIEVTHSDENDDKKFLDMYVAYNNTIAPKVEKEVDSVHTSELALAEKVNRFFTCARLISKRSFINFLRNPILIKGRIGQTVFLCFLICCIFFQITDNSHKDRLTYDINGSLFFFSIVMFMSNSFAVVLTFPAERAVFLREYSSNMYTVSSYYFGRSSVEIPFVIVFPVIYSAVCYFIIGYNSYNAGKFFFFLLIMISMALSGNAAGLLIGCSFSDPKVAANIMPALVLPFMVFSGFYINSSSMPVWLGWIQYLSPFRYSLEAFMRNQYSDLTVVNVDVGETFNFHLGLWGAFGILAGIGLSFRVLALLALKNLVRKLE